MQKHLKCYFCDQRFKVFKHKSSLFYYKNTKHHYGKQKTKTNSFSCNQCSKTFKHKNSVYVHKKEKYYCKDKRYM